MCIIHIVWGQHEGKTLSVDKQRIHENLAQLIGWENVSVKDYELFCYSRDGLYAATVSSKAGYLPDIVVKPVTVEDVVKVVRYANDHRISVVPWGAGTNRAGAALPVRGGIVLDMKSMDNILDIDEQSFSATVEAGVTIKKLNEAIKDKGLCFSAYDIPMSMATIGGSIAMNGFGSRIERYGDMRRTVLALEVVLPTGKIVTTKPVHRSTSGINLNQLFVGSEGILGIITKATLALNLLPEASSNHIYAFESFESAFQTGIKILRKGLVPSPFQVLDHVRSASHAMRSEKTIGAVLQFRFEGLKEEVELWKRLAIKLCLESGGEDLGKRAAQDWWETRHLGSWRSHLKMKHAIEDFAVPLGKVLNLYRSMDKVLKKFGLRHICGIALVSLSHGAMIVDNSFNEKDPESFERYLKLSREICRAAIKIGATVTMAHGVGIRLLEYMKEEHGVGLDVMKKIKESLDPNNIMNPGKMIPSA